MLVKPHFCKLYKYMQTQNRHVYWVLFAFLIVLQKWDHSAHIFPQLAFALNILAFLHVNMLMDLTHSFFFVTAMRHPTAWRRHVYLAILLLTDIHALPNILPQQTVLL